MAAALDQTPQLENMKPVSTTDSDIRRAHARRTALIFGAIAIGIYAAAIISVMWPR